MIPPNALRSSAIDKALSDPPTLGAFAVLILLGGANAVAIRFSNAELPPFWGATLRFGAASLLFFAFVFWRQVPLPRGRALAGVLIFGVLGPAQVCVPMR